MGRPDATCIDENAEMHVDVDSHHGQSWDIRWAKSVHCKSASTSETATGHEHAAGGKQTDGRYAPVAYNENARIKRYGHLRQNVLTAPRWRCFDKAAKGRK